MSYSAPVHTYNKECTYICNVVLGANYRPLSVYDSVSYNTTNSTKYRELSYETEGRSVTGGRVNLNSAADVSLLVVIEISLSLYH